MSQQAAQSAAARRQGIPMPGHFVGVAKGAADRKCFSYYQGQGFNLDFQADIITGHIDFVQIRNGYVHILDYKPEAKKEKYAHVQLTIYALALARRTGLKLKDVKCAWFDEKDYFEFFQLTGVYALRRADF